MSTKGRVEVDFEFVAERPIAEPAELASEGFAFGFALELALHAVDAALPSHGMEQLRYGPPLSLQGPRRCRAIVEPSTRRVSVRSWVPGTAELEAVTHLEGRAVRLSEPSWLQRVRAALARPGHARRVMRGAELEGEICAAAGAPGPVAQPIEQVVLYDDRIEACLRFPSETWPSYRLHPAIASCGWLLAGMWELGHGRGRVQAPIGAHAVHVLEPGARADRVWLVQLPADAGSDIPALVLAAERAGQITAVVHGLTVAPQGAEQRLIGLGVARRGELADALEERSPIERAERCAAYVRRLLPSALHERSAKTLPGDVPFRELGVTSAQSVMIASALSEALARPVSSTVLFDHPTIDDLVRAILAGVLDAPARRLDREGLPPALPSSLHEPVAVVGIGCRLPGAVFGPGDFFRLLCEGVNAVTPVSRARSALLGERAGSLRFLGALEDIEQFDARFFGISDREARAMDPQQRLLLEVTWHALEHAGVPPASLMNSRTSVFVGAAANEYARLFAERDAYTVVGNAASVAAGRLSYLLGTRGPSLCIDTACSSSLVAVCMACDSLQQGDADLAIAGGVNLVLDGSSSEGLAAAGALSPRGRCAAFDDAADGYVRGEGCGIVILRRLSDARARGDRVLAVIRGHAVGHGGRSNGLAAPNKDAQVELIARALARSGVRARDVGYVEAHGTGTTLGDAVELHSLAEAYGVGCGRSDTVLIGTAKTNLGHLEAAAGITGLIKAVLTLERGSIPPNLHYSVPLRSFDWAHSGLRVVTELARWPERSRRLAAVNAFGISGTYAHVVLEAAPPPATAARPVADQPLLVPISGRSEASVRRIAGDHARCLALGVDPAGLALAAGKHRDHHEKRAAVVGSGAEELGRQLGALALGERQVHERISAAPTVAFLYSGQGSQYLGMARGLFEGNRVFRDAFEECDACVAAASGASCLSLILGTADPGSLERAIASQPALFCLQYALGALWQSWGVTPDYVLGHSLGEYAAACAVGVLALSDAVDLVVLRARLIDTLPAQGAMLVLNTCLPTVEELLRACESTAEIAGVNAPRQVVVSGDAAAIARIAGEARARGIRAQSLPGRRAFHSRFVDGILDEFEQAVAGVDLRPARGRLISSTLGRAVDAEVCSTAYWREHTRRAVRFAEGVAALNAAGTQVYVEIGPDPVLLPAAAACATAGGRWLPSLRHGRPDLAQVLKAAAELYVAGGTLTWESLPGAGGASPAAIPGYAFDRRRYWARDEPVAVPDSPYYRVEWVARSAGAAERAVQRARWVVAGDEGAPVASLVAALANAGAPAAAVTPDAAFDQAEHEADGTIAYVMTNPAALDRAGPADVHAAAVDALRRVVALVGRLATHGGAPRRLWLVLGLGRDRASGAAAAIESALFSAAQVIGVEHPELWGGIASVHADALRGDDARVLAEALIEGAEDRLCIEAGKALVPRLLRASAPAAERALDPDATYLVSGGLGHIGLHVARWLAGQGVKHLVLTGRHADREGPDSAQPAAARQTVRELRERGVAVRCAAVDVCDEAAMRALFRSAAPGIAGIFHAAGTRGEVALRDTDSAHLDFVLRPKVQGAWTLHALAGEFAVQHFVLFSSLASIVGGRGQAAYAAANGFLDGLAVHRRALGLPAISIAWGPWGGEGGMAVAAPDAPYLASIGLARIDPARALVALDALLHAETACWAVADVDWEPFRGVYEARRRNPMLAALRDEAGAQSTAGAGALMQELWSLPQVERSERLHESVKRELRQVLGADHADAELERSFQELGLDSLGAVQLRSRIEQLVGFALPSTVVFDNPSLPQLVTALLSAARHSRPQPHPQAAE